LITALIRLARPRDWVKNVFVLAPLPFALADGAVVDPLRFALGFAAISLAGSAVYALNDVRDVELDRAHPHKRNRPVAAGLVPIGVALGFSAALAVAALSLGVAVGGTVTLLLGFYLAKDVIYNAGGKHLPLVDVFLISAGFLIRVLLGCALVHVTPSNWLLLCTATLALFLALTKRRADVVLGMGTEQRPSLQGYNLDFLNHATAITAGIALLSYALYSIEGGFFVKGRELASLPFVAFCILNYLRVAHLEGRGGDPMALALRDPSFSVAAAGWLAATGWSLGML
jgi:4-hydroxybenzoate polyprenyltransferase